jgi:predicted DNA-binding transcriptional regulator AlpA
VDRTLINRAAVARRLGHSLEWLYKNMRELLAQGFPMPVVGNLRAARWDPVAIDRWLDRRMARKRMPMAA